MTFTPPIERLGVINEHPFVLGETAVFQETPRASATRAVMSGQAHDAFQRPGQAAAGKLRQRFGPLGGVLPPHVAASGTAVTAKPDQPESGPPAEGFTSPACGSPCLLGRFGYRTSCTTHQGRPPGR